MRNRVFLPMAILFFCLVSGSGTAAGGTQETADVQVQFRVKWDGRIIPGITSVSGLKRVTEPVDHRSGMDSNVLRYSPGITRYVPIVLKRPRTHDSEFEQWANKVFHFGSGWGTESSLRDCRKDIIIELVDPSGRVLMAFRIYRCWPSEYTALSNLDADDDAPAMEILELRHEGWERDYAVH